MSLGDDWYRDFWEGYQEYVSAHARTWNTAGSEKQWSRFMFDFLTDMAQRLGYEEEEEEPAFRSRRFDRVWRREGDTIVLEHENWGVKYAIGDEVRKLARRTGDLHICITYLPRSAFPGSHYADRCLTTLSEERFEGEFLLILGTYEMSNPTDWICHRILPETTLKADMIVLPPLAVRSPGGTRGRSRKSKIRRESGWQGLKRTYPSSAAVTRVLRQAAKRRFKPGYVRTLENLKGYWERRGK